MKDILNKYKTKLVVGPLFKVIEAIFELFIPVIIAHIIDIGLKNNDLKYVINNILLIGLLYVIGFITSIISQYIASSVSTDIGEDLRLKLFKKVINNNLKVSSNNITLDINEVTTGINMAIRLALRAPTLLIGSIIMSFYINKSVTIIFILLTIIIFLSILLITNYSSKLEKKIKDKSDTLFNKISNIYEGIKVIRIFNTTSKEKQDINNLNNELYNLNVDFEKINSLASPLTFLTIQLSSIIILVISYTLLNIKLEGSLVALINYLNELMYAIIVIINISIIFIKSYISYKRISYILSTEDIKKGSKTIDTLNTISLVNVSFKDVLSNINLTIKKGDTIGIYGKTGSGKTTLVNLLNTLYKPTKGEILFNDISINDLSDKYVHDYIACVRQKPLLFNASLKKNIALDNVIDIDNINRSVRKALIDNKLNSINELAYEYGNNYSGGEKARIALSRAFYKPYQLLILDDSLSALDAKTKNKLIFNIDNNNDIKIIISSNKADLKFCNHKYIIEDGELHEEK